MSINEKKDLIGKTITDDKLNRKQAVISKICKGVARVSFHDNWNQTLEQLEEAKIATSDLTGNDLLSGMLTGLLIYSGMWLAKCMVIVSHDDTGYTKEEVLKAFINSLIEGFGAEATFVEDETPKNMHSPMGLKK